MAKARPSYKLFLFLYRKCFGGNQINNQVDLTANNTSSIQFQLYVIIMKTSNSFKIRNRDFMLQSLEQVSPNSSNCIFTSNLHTFSARLQLQSQSESLKLKKVKSKFWNQTEQRLFNQFWLQKFIENPSESFSFDAPLNRKSYNKAVSQYIINRGQKLNIECQKTPDQCKTKFATIKRKIQRERKKLGVSLQFDFIDYIIQKAETYIEQDGEIQVKVQKVKQLRQNKSPFIKITLQQYGFIKCQNFRQTFDCLLEFLEQFQKKINVN